MHELTKRGIWLIGGLLAAAGLASGVTVSAAQHGPGEVGIAFSLTLTATGGTSPYSWSLSEGTLPGGLTLASAGTNTGSIAGIPAVPSVVFVTVRATDALGNSGSTALSLQISAALTILSVSPLAGGSVGILYDHAIAVSGGGGIFTWVVESGALPPGLSLNVGGGIRGTPTTVGVFSFTVTVSDTLGAKASAAFTLQITAQPLSVTTPGSLPTASLGVPYSVTLTAAGGAPPYKWSPGSTMPAGLTLSSSGVLAGTPTESCANCPFGVSVTDVANNIAYGSFTILINPPALSITTSSPLPAGKVGVAYTYLLRATGGDPALIYIWLLDSGKLPAGLGLNPNGTIAGTPSVLGTFSFTVLVKTSPAAPRISETVKATFALTIAAAPITIDLTSSVATIDEPFGAAISVTGGAQPYSWSLIRGQLPPGLSLAAATGTISGTPTTLGDYHFTVQVSDTAGTIAVKDLVLTILPPLPILSAIRNSASYGPTLAQGAMVVIFGYALGPAALVQASTFPLPKTLAGTSVTVTSGGVTLDCPLVYVSATQIAAILPSNTPPASAETSPWSGAAIVVTVKGRPSGYPDDLYFWPRVTVVPSATGLYTLDSSGAGPGIFTSLDGIVKTFTNSAKPGEVLTTWATGTGPIDSDDALPPGVKNLPGFEVWAGSQSAKVLYAGPSPCCAGLAQISFELPQVPDTCFLPVTVRGGGVVSNSVTLAVDHGGGACNDTQASIPRSIYTRAAAGE